MTVLPMVAVALTSQVTNKYTVPVGIDWLKPVKLKSSAPPVNPVLMVAKVASVTVSVASVEYHSLKFTTSPLTQVPLVLATTWVRVVPAVAMSIWVWYKMLFRVFCKTLLAAGEVPVCVITGGGEVVVPLPRSPGVR